MSSAEYEKQLTQAGIHLTALRLLVWRTLRTEFQNAFSLADVEQKLPTVDRSSIFRSLVTFVSAKLLHEVDDGSGAQKYCVCHSHNTLHCHGHVHLTCRICHRTFCLVDVKIPPVPIPQGFAVEETEYIVKGICSDCATQQ